MNIKNPHWIVDRNDSVQTPCNSKMRWLHNHQVHHMANGIVITKSIKRISMHYKNNMHKVDDEIIKVNHHDYDHDEQMAGLIKEVLHEPDLSEMIDQPANEIGLRLCKIIKLL